MNVNVKFGDGYLPCIIKDDGVCRYCGEPILWAVTPNGKFVPLEPEKAGPGVMESHLDNCRARGNTRRRTGKPPPLALRTGIEMTVTVWRQLLRLVHPDKHHGSNDERLANDLTGWLIEQRPRLKQEGQNRDS